MTTLIDLDRLSMYAEICTWMYHADPCRSTLAAIAPHLTLLKDHCTVTVDSARYGSIVCRSPDVLPNADHLASADAYGDDDIIFESEDAWMTAYGSRMDDMTQAEARAQTHAQSQTHAQAHSQTHAQTQSQTHAQAHSQTHAQTQSQTHAQPSNGSSPRAKMTELIIAFRGSNTTSTLLVNLVPWEVPWVHATPRALSTPNPIRVHQGYLEHYQKVKPYIMRDVRDFLRDVGLTENVVRITFTGHSLGGSCASIAALDLSETLRHGRFVHAGTPPVEVGCVTFGALPAGNAAFKTSFEEHVPFSLRVVNPWDPAPHMDKILMKPHVHGRVDLHHGHIMDPISNHNISTYTKNIERINRSSSSKLSMNRLPPHAYHTTHTTHTTHTSHTSRSTSASVTPKGWRAHLLG